MPRRNLTRIVLLLAIVGLVGAAALLTWLYQHAGMYGLNILAQRGGSYWVTVAPDSPRLSPSMRLALRGTVPMPVATDPTWQAVATGLDVAEMPVTIDGIEVDRLLLARIDPAHLRLIVRTAPAGDRDLPQWMQALGAVLVVNGSYYDRMGRADTPLVSDSQRLGPASYEARHGAFVATANSAGIRDLREGDWRAALAGATDGFVSYPMLLARDGSSRAGGDYRWLANRSFVGEDAKGRIIIGTTTDAFFSLARFGAFLRGAPLGLVAALNLDGGPVACQGISAGAYRRDFCGAWETKTEGEELRLLRWPLWWRRFSLPIVLVAVPR